MNVSKKVIALGSIVAALAAASISRAAIQTTAP